jgi:hypothetical protein
MAIQFSSPTEDRSEIDQSLPCPAGTVKLSVPSWLLPDLAPAGSLVAFLHSPYRPRCWEHDLHAKDRENGKASFHWYSRVAVHIRVFQNLQSA